MLASHLINGQRLLISLMVPSVVGFLIFGDVMAGLLFQRGRFTAGDSQYVWMVLAGSAVGLIATTIGRFYASAFYAIGDTKTPARVATGMVAAMPAQAQTTLTLNGWAGPTHLLTADILVGWAKEVEKASNGRIKYSLLPKAPAAPSGSVDYGDYR